MVMGSARRVAGPEILHRSRWRSRPNERTWLWQSKKVLLRSSTGELNAISTSSFRVAVDTFMGLFQAGVAQTATYHLHKEVSAITAADDKLLTAGPTRPAWPLRRRLPAKQWASI